MQEHFELDDKERDSVVALVAGKPNFLKTTGMLRDRQRNETSWTILTENIAKIFSDDIESAAPT
eukprot:3945656-Prymnesium_polylepis.1